MMTIAIIELMSAVFLGLLLWRQLSERSEMKSGRYLRIFTGLMLISLISDGLAYVIQEPYVPFPLVYLNCLLAYTAGGVNALGLAWYSEALFAEKFKLNSWVFRTLKLAGIIWIAAVVQAFLAGKLVVFENGLEVAYYDFPPILATYQIAVMLYVPVLALVYRKKLGREAVILLSVLSTSPLLGLLATPVTGEDYSYVFSAVALILVSNFLQRKQQTAIIRSLAGEYTALFHVNLDSGLFTTHNVSDRVPDTAESVQRNEKFTEIFSDFVNSSAIYAEDRETARAMYLSDAAVKAALAHKKSLRAVYRRKYGNEYLWTEMNIIKDEAVDEEPRSIAVGFIEKDAEIRREQEQQRQLEEALYKANRETERNDFLYDIMNASKWSYEINAADEVIAAHYSQGVYQQTHITRETGKPMGWVELLHPEDKERVFEEFMAAIRDHSGRAKYDTSFRVLGTDGTIRWAKSAGRIIRRSDGTGELFGMSVDLTKQIEKEREQQKKLENSLEIIRQEKSRVEVVRDMIHSAYWTFTIDKNDIIIDAGFEGDVETVLNINLEISPHAWEEILHPEDKERVLKEFYAAIADHSGNTPYDVNYRMLDRTGNYNWFHSAGKIIELQDGTREFFGIHININDRIAKEQKLLMAEKTELELQHEQFKRDALNEFVVDNDADPVELFSEYAERLRLLIGCDQVIYRGFKETRILVNDPAFAEEWMVPIEYCRQCPHSDIYNPLYKDGYTEMNNCQREGWRGIPVYEKCPVKSALTRIVYCDGEPAGYLAIHYIQEYHQFTDIERSTLEEITRILSVAVSRYKAKTENKELKKIAEMQDQLEEALSMAQSANRAKTVFLNNMSHDIRTPMNAIIGFTGLAVKHIDERERLRDYLGKIGQSSEHLLSLINEVLDMSRIESGKMSLDEKNENLDSIINNLQDIVQANMQAKQHKFLVETANLNDKNVICDKLRLNQVLLNILSNSIKYTNAGGRISLKVTEKGKKPSGYATYEFRIQDNGMGMDKEYLKVIFDPFTRVKSSTVSGIQGTGLGMAITKNFVDMMGGSIEVESELGKGTIMTVTFDFKVAAEENKATAAVPAAEEHDFRGKKILLVEDNELNMEIASELLTEYGFVLDTANDGSVAVEKMKAAKVGDYDIVLMDVQMPVLGGYEATQQIRALGTEISKIPILAMTANAFEEDRRRAIEAGMNDHIAKPIDIDKLKETLARFL